MVYKRSWGGVYLSSFEFTDMWNQSKMNLWPRKGESGTEIEGFSQIYG